MSVAGAIKRLFAGSEPIAPPQTGELAVATSTLYSNLDFGKYNPDALLANKGAAVYDMMMRDDQVKPVVRFKISAITSRRWQFKKNPNNPFHAEVEPFLLACIDGIDGSFKDDMEGILSALVSGFSISEKIIAPMDYEGKTYWTIKALKLRDWKSFRFKVDKFGNVESLIQTDGAQEHVIPYDKVVHFVHQPDIDEHYGESDLRACYRAWWSKDIAIKLHNIYLERMASGFIYAEVGQATQLSVSQRGALKSLLDTVTGKTSAVVPEGVQLKQFPAVNTEAYEKAVAMHNKSIARAVLVPNLLGLSEQGASGSYAQSQTQFDAFLWTLGSIITRLEDCINSQIIAPLVKWNYGRDDYPRFHFVPLTDDQISKLANTWSQLVTMKAVQKTAADESYFRELLGVPANAITDKESGAEILEYHVSNGIVTPNEVRAFLGLPAIAGGDKLATPEPAPAKDVPAPPVKEEAPEPEDGKEPSEYTEKPYMARVNFKEMKQGMDTLEAAFVENVNPALALMRVSIEKQIAAIWGTSSGANVEPSASSTLKIAKPTKSRLNAELKKGLTDAYTAGYDGAQSEIKKKLTDSATLKTYIGTIDEALKFLESEAFKITGVIEQDALAVARQVVENGIKYDKSLKQVINDLDDMIGDLLPAVDAAGNAINIPARLENIARTNTASAINQGRQAFFEDPALKGYILGYEYSAILDGRTTAICKALDGVIRKDFGNYAPPNHYQCRSLLIPITIDDTDKLKETPLPAVTPMKGFYSHCGCEGKHEAGND